MSMDGNIITALKGSPSYSIDANGIMSITTTWMVMPVGNSDGYSDVSWLAFEADVEKWAGKVGDYYKQPIIPEGEREATTFTTNTLFIVSDISYGCVDGRTHYEVTFNHVQNFETMRLLGNISLEVSESNEKTKTATYVITVEPNDPMAIDAKVIASGSTVDWAGAEFLVTSSSYSAESPTQYSVSITAQDMQYRMIGNPTKNTDAFGQHTMRAVWRMSAAYYDSEWVQPAEGSDASPWLGLEDGSGYIVASVSVEPNGVVGYDVTIEAKHVSKRLVKMTKNFTEKASKNSSGYNVKHTLQYQSDAENVSDFETLMGDDASSLLDSTYGRISEVSIDENGRNDYNIQVVATTEPKQGNGSTPSDDNDPQVSVSMSQGSFVLEPQQAGWFKGLSGEFYRINFPPTTRYTYTTTVASLRDMMSQSMSSKNKDSAILDAIRNEDSTIGYDRVIAVQAIVDNKPQWVVKDARKSLQLKDVSTLKMEGFVYAQPTMTKDGETLRSLLFEVWEGDKKCPVIPEDGFSTWDDRDLPVPKKLLSYKIQTMDISVGMHYKGNTAKILKNPFSEFYKKAINYIKCDAFTSYKGTGISVNETTDDSGDTWTQVTCNISSLLASNTYALEWNKNYDDSYVE